MVIIVTVAWITDHLSQASICKGSRHKSEIITTIGTPGHSFISFLLTLYTVRLTADIAVSPVTNRRYLILNIVKTKGLMFDFKNKKIEVARTMIRGQPVKVVEERTGLTNS